jgi:tripartite-type tricarboxylate transporter receptor subunit TctC
VVARLNAALHAALRDAEAVRKLAQQGIEPLPSTPEEATAFMQAEAAKWGEVVRLGRIGEG